MAKQQTFGDKTKKKGAASKITVKFVKTVKTEKGSYKFQEKFVRLDEIGQVQNLK